MELYASDMFFRGDNEKEQAYDSCIHGKVIFRIGEQLLSDDTEWCISASAYRFYILSLKIILWVPKIF